MINEVAPPTKKHERMVKHIKKAYAKKGGLSDEEKSIAYATAWKNYNKEEVVLEKVKGQDPEVRKAMSSERKSGSKRLSAKAGENYANQQKQSIRWHDKRTKGRFAPGEVSDANESFEIDPQKHRKAKRDAKIRNLAKDNKNPNEKSAAERKLKGPKLAWEDFKQEIIEREDSPYEKASSGALAGKTRSSGASKTEPKTGFGRKAHRNSAAMIIRAKRKAERSGKKLSADSAAELAHRGWASSVKHHQDSMTPEQRERRNKLAKTKYKDLSKDEQDKDKVSAKAIMSVHDKRKKK